MHIAVLRTSLKKCVSKWDSIGEIISFLMINTLKFILSEKKFSDLSCYPIYAALNMGL